MYLYELGRQKNPFDWGSQKSKKKGFTITLLGLLLPDSSDTVDVMDWNWWAASLGGIGTRVGGWSSSRSSLGSSKSLRFHITPLPPPPPTLSLLPARTLDEESPSDGDRRWLTFLGGDLRLENFLLKTRLVFHYKKLIFKSSCKCILEQGFTCNWYHLCKGGNWSERKLCERKGRLSWDC